MQLGVVDEGRQPFCALARLVRVTTAVSGAEAKPPPAAGRPHDSFTERDCPVRPCESSATA
ncbi:hypothetical protein ACFQ0B_21515 [Nonomuraea thailandensis]